MFGKMRNAPNDFDALCEAYYERVLRYLFAVLESETAARDCTQEVFVIACRKMGLLRSHPNPGGFLLQTAKNLSKQFRRESFRAMMRETPLDNALGCTWRDDSAGIDAAIDRKIDEWDYVEHVLSQLSDEKRALYTQYYVDKKSMAEIARSHGVPEPTMRMRFVRLRREIRAIVSEIAEKSFG